METTKEDCVGTDQEGFDFVDLFAGIGGFHAALSSLGGRCVYAAEWDDDARAVYEAAWSESGWKPGVDYPFVRDINSDVEVVREADLRPALEDLVEFPEHDALTAGFPCQAFSKSGRQQGILDAARGTLFYNILRIVRAKRPKVVFLENVRNLAGPKHRKSTFKTIIESLFDLGYIVSDQPTVISPHRIHPQLGGTPQLRERIYIMAIHRTAALGLELGSAKDRIRWTDVNRPFLPDIQAFSAFSYGSWDPQQWRIRETPLALYGGEPVVLADCRIKDAERLRLGEFEGLAVDAWDRFVRRVVNNSEMKPGDGVRRLPGFPIWLNVVDKAWLKKEREDAEKRRKKDPSKGRGWKHKFLDDNEKFVRDYRQDLNATVLEVFSQLRHSRRKFEWQAQDASSLDECLVQLRPSGIRVKKDTYTPALVAINQTPILGKERRRLAVEEAARLQGFPKAVTDAMRGRLDAPSYKQLGNAVHVGAVGFALAQFLQHFESFGRIDASLTEIRKRWDARWRPSREMTMQTPESAAEVTGDVRDDGDPQAA